MVQAIFDHGDGWWVDDAHRIPTTKSSSLLAQPRMVVLHWTAAPYRNAAQNLARIKRWAANTGDKSSTHFSIQRDGQIYQLVQTTRAAWHAGASTWVLADGAKVPPKKSETSVNRYSIGIDFDLVGPVTPSDDHWIDCYGGTYTGPEPVYSADTHKWYEPVQDCQLYACRILLDALRSQFAVDLHDIVGHIDVSPGRKIDPGPFINHKSLGFE